MASSAACSRPAPLMPCFGSRATRPAAPSTAAAPAWLPARRQRAVSAAAQRARSSGAVPAAAAPQPLESQPSPTGPGAAAATAAAAAVLLLGAAGPALALDIRMEPSNALSLPTWAVHTSSVLEWITAMGLMWRYGEVSGNPRWKGMAWGMMPCLGSAMCACTWHFFYNSPDLQFLVALQAALTVVGNFTCWWAAYRIYQGAQQQQGA